MYELIELYNGTQSVSLHRSVDVAIEQHKRQHPGLHHTPFRVQLERVP